MFPELRNYLDELKNSAESTSAFLRKLNGARTRLRNSITKSEEQVKSLKDENKYFAKIRTEIEKSAIKTAKNITFFNATHAVRINEEFNEPPYRNSLFRAIEDSNAYLFIRVGSGFSGDLKIRINLDKTAGRLDRWAAGVKAYRKILDQEKESKARESAKKKGKRYKKSQYDPIAASRAWAGIYSNRSGTFSQFQNTIRQRLSLSGALAPFWQLLDKGEVPLRSDRGGFPTPSKTETNFVHESEKEVNTLLSNALREERKRYYELFAQYREFIAEAENKLVELNNLADEIRLDLKVVRNLERRLNIEQQYINSNKLEKAVQLIREGLITGGRIDISAAGSKKRTRVSVNTLKGLL